MSCVVAVRHSRGVVLGADSASVDTRSIERTKKVFRVGRVWLALVGELKAFDRVIVEAQKTRRRRDLRAWVAECCAWCSAVSGIAVCGRQAVSWIGGDCVSEIVDYCAIGLGDDVARGALHCAVACGLSPRRRVIRALRAAATHAPGVMGPFVLVERGRVVVVE